MLACSEVTRLLATEEIRNAPLSRRLAVRLHLMICQHCRRYVRELAAIGAAARSLAGRVPGGDSATPELERRILDAVRQPTTRDPGGI